MRRFRRPRGLTEEPAAASLPVVPAWKARALELAGTWLVVDRGLRVIDASSAALRFFEAPALPASIIAVTRSAAAEAHAREVVAGEHGPWEFDASHFHVALRLRGEPVGDGVFLLLFEDVTELRRLEAMRADFVANLAHELRTPVASLSLAVETLASGLPPHEQGLFVERIAEETRYIEGLLRSVTELALLEGDVRLNRGSVELRRAVEESWRRVTARQGAAALANMVPAELAVWADAVRVSEILQNLLENAHRFSPEGTAVEVRGRHAGAEVEVSVQDHGPGIPSPELSRVFERFYKVDRARTRRGDGSGLGLAITRHLVMAHGGRIWAEAPAEGGTRIVFTLPSEVNTAAEGDRVPGPSPGGDDPGAQAGV